MKRKLQVWMIELRAPFLTATLVSIILGTVIAWVREDMFNFQYFLLALLGGVSLHLGANIANDYFDHRSGNDEINKEFVRPFSGGSRMIQSGLLSPREVLFGSILFYALATLIGVYFALTQGLFILILGLIGLVSGFFYTGIPFNWASRGIGEALVGINFGTLMTLGAYYVQTGTLALEPLIVSLPISLLIAAVLYINEFLDYNADKAVGKNTLVVRLGRANAVYGYALLVMGAYVIILLNVLALGAPSYILMAFITLPLALEAVKQAFKSHSQPVSLIPANALTILFHFLASLLISLGYLSYRFEILSLGYFSVMSIVGLCVILTVYFYFKTKSPQKRQP